MLSSMSSPAHGVVMQKLELVLNKLGELVKICCHFSKIKKCINL